ncbi:MAG: AAA family ATPase [Methanomassiliicoccus sp.]|nr:AAA family ATPase [Methanomassiliicoccus sp.]
MDQTARIKTYIEGFDRAMEGGIPQGNIVLIAGTPGTMKSSLTYYSLYNQAKENGATCVYVTLEQSRNSLLRQMEKMGMRTDDVKQTLHVLDLGLIRKNLKQVNGGDSWMQVFKGYITSLKNDLGFSMIAIDSLGVLETISSMTNRRTDLFYLFEWLRDLNSTVLLISEAAPDKLFDGYYDEGYLADGIITLKMQVVRDVEIQRRIRCVKMRETNHDPSYFSLIHSGGKFQVTKAISE